MGISGNQDGLYETAHGKKHHRKKPMECVSASSAFWLSSSKKAGIFRLGVQISDQVSPGLRPDRARHQQRRASQHLSLGHPAPTSDGASGAPSAPGGALRRCNARGVTNVGGPRRSPGACCRRAEQQGLLQKASVETLITSPAEAGSLAPAANPTPACACATARRGAPLLL